MTERQISLIEMLATRRLESGIYQGETINPGWRRVYGGHVLAQALAAATKEVPQNRNVHSFHSYFVRPGDIHQPIVYDVESIRDGGSISTRRVKAMQKNAVIFFMTASFQNNIAGYEHQNDMPDIAPPDQLASLDELLAARYGKTLPTPAFRSSFDIRPVEPYVVDLNTKREPRCHIWIKTTCSLPDDLAIHEFLLAYASDMLLLSVATFPHGADYSKKDFQMATIDHSMWFHRPFRFDDWLLYAIESPNASGGRGFCTGRFFDRQGNLVASTAQEGVTRNRSSSST